MDANLIILEGPDGVGKSTIAKAISKLIPNSEVMAFPGNQSGTLGKLIYDLHHHQIRFDLSEAVSASAMQALHIAAHMDAAERLIMPKLREGVTVILDRYNFSTWVYGTIYGAHPETLSKLIDAEEALWYSMGIDDFNTYFVMVDAEEPYEDFERGQQIWESLRYKYLSLYNSLISGVSTGGMRESNWCANIKLVTNNGQLSDAVNAIMDWLNVAEVA